MSQSFKSTASSRIRFNKQNCEVVLRQGLSSMGLLSTKPAIDDNKISALLAYLKEFHKWNQAYNLSAIRQPEEMVRRHLLDSLTLATPLHNYCCKYHEKAEKSERLQTEKSVAIRLIDVGTGGGLPGLPLAIVFPDIQVTLLDSNGKKTRFLFQTVVKLGLKNVRVENNRVEKFSPADKFDIVTSRAFASLQDMVNGCQHLVDANVGEYWAMKGLYPEEELAACGDSVDIKSLHELQVPDSDAERHLLILKNKQSAVKIPSLVKRP